MIIPPKESQSESTLKDSIKKYLSRAKEIEKVLSENPNDWGIYQNEFNNSLCNLFTQIMLFEKKCFLEKNEEKIRKLKSFFVKNFRKYFLRGQFIRHSFEKPFGYAGDFRIIDYIYQCYPTTTGFDRLFDNFFLSSPASAATRHRKEDFKRYLAVFGEKVTRPFYVLDLASGPCRDIFELLGEHPILEKMLVFTCLDGDSNAIEYARQLLGARENVYFVKENIARLALKKNPEAYFPQKFNVIFSTGLFDYLDERLAIRLVANLRKMLCPGGRMIISNYRDRFSNPSLHFMEWVGDWPLVYRSDSEFKKIFLNAGFLENSLSYDYELQGIMMYYTATL